MSGAPRGHGGCFHEAAHYGSDDDLLGIVLPFLDDGREAGEPTLVLFDEDNAGLIHSACDDPAGVTFEPAPTRSTRPATALRVLRERIAGLVAEGASGVRVVGEVPVPDRGGSWEQWARYEAAVNHAFEDLPLWALCLYDTRTTPDQVLDVVERTHPHLGSLDGSHRPNPRYEDPRTFASTYRDGPLLQCPPSVSAFAELVDPSPHTARQAVAAVCATAALDESATAGLLVAVSEIVTNAHEYGAPPVRVRAWAEEGRVVVTATDQGSGPDDPLAGYLPRPADAPRGRGLWIVHQLCDRVTMDRGRDGFTVGVTAEVTQGS
jgi:anti-sigma regulatory factor (Ser/Thr protein kinase)